MGNKGSHQEDKKGRRVVPTEGAGEVVRIHARPSDARRTFENGCFVLQDIAEAYVPPDVTPPAPLLLLCHGSEESGTTMIDRFRGVADTHGMVLLAPHSKERTWDIIQTGSYGHDTHRIETALEWVFGSITIDPQRVAIVGFSDGASYALSLGLLNGDLFRDILCFSPGGIYLPPTAPRNGHPRVFAAHGAQDEVLNPASLDIISRHLVSYLAKLSPHYDDVRYEEFEGGHYVPPAVVDQALTWLLLHPRWCSEPSV